VGTDDNGYELAVWQSGKNSVSPRFFNRFTPDSSTVLGIERSTDSTVQQTRSMAEHSGHPYARAIGKPVAFCDHLVPALGRPASIISTHPFQRRRKMLTVRRGSRSLGLVDVGYRDIVRRSARFLP